MTELCPCGTRDLFERCCGPYLAGSGHAPTAEALMRARYSAYVTTNIDFLIQTTHPQTRHHYQPEELRAWSQRAHWQRLEIVMTNQGGAQDQEGTVQFAAYYAENGQSTIHRELSLFKKLENRWYFHSGREPATKVGTKVGRNAPCPCGSGIKFKKCCDRRN